jgi:hypothetical protein
MFFIGGRGFGMRLQAVIFRNTVRVRNRRNAFLDAHREDVIQGVPP